MGTIAARIDLAEESRANSARLLGTLALGAAATVLTIWAVARSPVLESPTFTAISRGLYVATTIAAGVYVWRRQPRSRLGPLLLAIGFVFALASLNASADPVWFSIGMTAWAFFLVMILYAYVCFPRGRLGSRLERGVVHGYITAVAIIWALLLAMSNTLPAGGPFIRCGSDCPVNGLRFIDVSDSVARGLVVAFNVVTAIAVLVVAVLIFGKARSPSHLRRRAIVPLSIVFIVMILDFVLYLLLEPSFPGTGETLRLVDLAASLGVPIAIVVGQHRASSYAARSAGRLVAGSQGDRVAPSGIEELLQDSLGDPSLSLALWSSERGGYVDVGGRPLELPDTTSGRAVTPVTRRGLPVAAIIHDQGLDERREVMDGLSATSLMLLENTRLVEELQASRARIVAAGDQERLRLERDLHDGAQQRLMAIQIKLALVRDLTNGDAELAARLEEIGADAATAVEELRALAHGIYPTVLRERGLADGLGSFSRTASIPVDVVDRGIGRHSAELEGAIYFCATEAIQNAVKHAGPEAEVTVVLERAGDGVSFTITDNGSGFEAGRAGGGVGLVSMRDRIGAVGGALKIESWPGRGTAIRGTVPG
jgi:signal transduction histidine kinase